MSSTTPLPRRRLGRTRAATALAAAGALIMSAGVIGLVASPASADKPGDKGKSSQANDKGSTAGKNETKNEDRGQSGEKPDKKVHKSYVCKYVGTPGVDERLQTGQNPIWVDNNALVGPKGGETYVGQEFSDKHGRSVVIVANTKKLDPEPGVGQCPSPRQPDTRTPAGVNYSDLCGPNNASWSAKPDTYFDYGVSDGMIRATLKTAYANDAVSGTTSWPLPVDSNQPCDNGGTLLELSPAVTFTDADCDNLGEEDWDGTMESVLDYEATGDVGPGETVTVKAMIEPAQTGKYKFAPGAKTEFSHTFEDVTLADCVAGEETIVPKPKPEPKPDKKPTVKGVQVVVPPAAAPAAAPTAVAAGLGDTAAASPIQTIAQILVAGGMLLLMAGAWIGLGRREYGTHEA